MKWATSCCIQVVWVYCYVVWHLDSGMDICFKVIWHDVFTTSLLLFLDSAMSLTCPSNNSIYSRISFTCLSYDYLSSLAYAITVSNNYRLYYSCYSFSFYISFQYRAFIFLSWFNYFAVLSSWCDTRLDSCFLKFFYSHYRMFCCYVSGCSVDRYTRLVLTVLSRWVLIWSLIVIRESLLSFWMTLAFMLQFYLS